jgi:hypothetical protein
MTFSFDELALGARLLIDLPFFLRRPITVEAARAEVRARRECRATDFLRLVQTCVYGRTVSPYLRLLELAGCEPGDLERLVRKEGLEGALKTLYQRGVYLTVDELKGRQAVVRGSARFELKPLGLRNPRAAAHLRVRSGATRSAGTPLVLDLAFLRDWAIDSLLLFHARGGDDWRHAVWDTPGSSAWAKVLRLAIMARPAEHWYSQVKLRSAGLDPRYRRAARLLRWGGRLAGVRLPAPRYVSLEDPGPILDWVVEVKRAGDTPHVWTISSSAVRLCEAALERGVDVAGLQLTATSEPLTEARLAAIKRAGANAVGNYGTMEAGSVSLACLNPSSSDDSHLMDDFHALIQAGEVGAERGLPPQALLLTTFRPTAPMILFNASLGDQADLEPRSCGCPLEQEGWAVHLERVRSFEKLTAGGMTFLDTDVIDVLERVLPARFGGGPTHYQLVEQESAAGRPRLLLVVHPAVGPLDESALREAFLDALGTNSAAERVMSQVWREGDFLRVERAAPHLTPSGKIQHLHVARRATSRQ